MSSTSRPFVLWGSAGHAKVLAQLVRDVGGKVIALFDNSHLPPALPDVPIFFGNEGFDRWADACADLGRVSGLVAIGGSRGGDRLAIQSQFAARGLLIPSAIHPMAWVCGTATVGAGTQILAMASVAAEARLGAACIINHGARVDHECVIEDGVHLAPGSVLCGCVTVRRTAMIGAGAVVLPRITIGEGAIVGAGAVVTRDIAPGDIVVGAPARSTTTSTKPRK